MFEAISSVSGVLILIVILYTFRKNVKQVQEELPEVVGSVIRPAVKAAKQLELVVTTNCNENTVDLAKRTHEVRGELDTLGIPSVKDAEAYILGLK